MAALGQPIFESLEARLLLTDVGGHIAASTVWDNAAEPYVLQEDLIIDAGATLQIADGVQVESVGGTSLSILIDGALDADGATFWVGCIQARDNAQLDLAGCGLGDMWIDFAATSSGTVDSCYKADWSWEVDTASPNVTITGSTGLGVYLTASAALFGSDLEWLELGGGAPTIQENTLRGDPVFWLDDPATDLANVSGNTVTSESPWIGLSGSVDAPLALGVVNGIGDYRITGGLTIRPGASISLAPGVTLCSPPDYWAEITVEGTFEATGLEFPNATFIVKDGGTLNLTDCTLDGAWVEYEAGSGGSLNGCHGGGEVAWQVSIASAAVSVVDCTQISYVSLYDSASITGSDFWYLLFGGGAPTVTGNTIHSGIRVSDPDADLGNFSGNSLTGEQSVIYLSGVLDNSRTLRAANGIYMYGLDGPLDIRAGATLDTDAGVVLRTQWDTAVPITVEGTFTAADSDFSGAQFIVRPGGTLNLANCRLGPGSVTFESGSSGSLSGCGGNESLWDLWIADDGVSVTACSDLGRVHVSASASVTGSAMQYVEFAGGAPTFQGNYLAEWWPIRLLDPDTDPAGISGNTYQWVNAYLPIQGTLEGARTLRPIDGRSSYEIVGDLVVESGAALTVGAGVVLEESGAGVTVKGTLTVADGGTFGGAANVSGTLYGQPGSSFLWGELRALAGGRIEFSNCTVSGPDVYFDPGSSGSFTQCGKPGDWSTIYVYSDGVTLADSYLGWVENYASPTLTGNTLEGIEIYSGTPTVQGNTFTYWTPVWINDPDCSLAGFSGNTYPAESEIVIGGTLDGALSLGPLEGIASYQVADQLVVSPVASLTIESGISMGLRYGAGIFVDGVLSAAGAALSGLNITARAGGRADLTDCTLSGLTVFYQPGAAGSIDGCQAGPESVWSVESAAEGLTVADSTGLDHVRLDDSAAIRGSILGYLVVARGTPTVQYCTFSDAQALRILDPDVDLNAVAGNTFLVEDTVIVVGGTVDGAKTLNRVNGLNRYVLKGDLAVAAGAALDLAEGVSLDTDWAASGNIDVYGTLTLHDVTFRGTAVCVYNGGTANLIDCTIEDAPPSVGPSGNDAWDVSSGITYIGGTPTMNSPLNMFGGNDGQVEPGHTVFVDWYGAGFTHTVEWCTPRVISLKRFKLYATGDGPWSQKRTMDFFRLWAKDLGTGQFQVVYSAWIPSPYGTPYPDDPELLLNVILPQTVESSDFYAEFRQATNIQWAKGPRIIELDGYETGLGQASLTALSGGELNLAACEFSGGRVTYENGAAGTVDDCHAAPETPAWELQVRDDDVTVCDSSGCHVTVTDAAPTLEANTLDHLDLQDQAAPVVAGNAFTSTTPLRLDNMYVNLAGVSDNT